jgi:hypothetical protein
MASKRVRVAMALTAVVAAMSLVNPAPAAAADCGKFQQTCQEIENQWCYLTHRCL